MHRILTLLLVTTLSQVLPLHAVELGIDVLQRNNFDLLRGKRVGLVPIRQG